MHKDDKAYMYAKSSKGSRVGWNEQVCTLLTVMLCTYQNGAIFLLLYRKCTHTTAYH